MKRYITIIAALAALMSCQKEGTASVQDDGQISFEMNLPETKATATEFEVGDKVAVFAVEYTSDEAPELQIAGNFLNNECLTFDGAQWFAANKLYWSTRPCDFYAVYPYQKISYVDAHSFEIATEQNAPETGSSLSGYETSDILWAKDEAAYRVDPATLDPESPDYESIIADNGKVCLNFRHLMSKCVVTVTKGEKFEGEIPDDIVCHIYNTTTSAKLNFAKGSVEKDATGQRKTITMKKHSNQRFEAIVVPQNIEIRTPLIEVTMGGIAYLLEYSLSFKPGYVHTLNLILNTSPDQEKIEISIDAGVDPMNN